MMANYLIAILVATLVVVSGAAGFFYLAGAQDQAEQAEITLSSTEPRLGSEIDVDGSNFGADDEVSIYIMSSAQASLINGDVYPNDERVEVMIRGEEVLAPTNIEMDFQGEHSFSAANRLEMFYGAVTSGLQ